MRQKIWLTYLIIALMAEFRKQNFHFTLTLPNCLKYRNKGKDHNSQKQQSFL